MRKFLAGLMVFVSLIQAQTPIIRVMQSREYKTPKTWWREPLTFNLRGYLADDTTGMSTATNASGVALYNNNFDAWRDSVMTLAVTLQDDGAEVTAFRIDLVFDNDLIDWNHDSTRVEKGSYLSSYTEGDEDYEADYSYEVVRYNDAGYVDSLQTAGSEISQVNDRYDWLRVTMVSHGLDDDGDGNPDMTFGNGANVQTELVKFHFKIEDVVDDFSPRSFRVPTKYNGQTGYYTYVTDGYYATDYKLYIDGNVGTSEDGVGNGRGDITLHPKLLDVEGYFRYVQGNGYDGDNTYPYWKIRFELDQDNPQSYNSWYNIETVEDESGETDEGTTDDDNGDIVYFHYYKRNDRIDVTQDYTNAKVSDPSNIPYKFLTYTEINSMGRNWIRKYTLALSKELLGIIRSKYASLPLPNGEVNMDGEALKSEGREEKANLLEELNTFLEAVSKKEQALTEQEVANSQQEVLNKAPLKIYIG